MIEVASVDTGNTKLDTHLRSADLYDTSTLPSITYEATGLSADGRESVRLSSALTIGGHTRPFEVTAKVTKGGPSALSLTTSSEVDRS